MSERTCDRPTVALDPTTMQVNWPIVIASLERLNSWATLAMRLGTLELVKDLAREMANPEAKADLVVKLRELADALAHMPWEA